MTQNAVSARRNTIARSRQALTVGSVRAAFGMLERASPALGARWAERLWFTVPGGQARRRHRPEPGRLFEVRLHAGRMVGESWGEGPVVYLMHGWGGQRGDLGALITPLTAAGYRVVAFDAPSHGESEPGPAGPRRSTFLEFSDLLAAVCAAEGPAYAVIAHSGGCMATAVCVLNGLPADRLVFFAPMSDLTAYTYEFARRVGFGERVRTRMVPRLQRRVATPLSVFDIPAIARRISPRPLLLVHDRNDNETPYSGSEAIAETWPGARLITTTGLGHRRIMHAPDVVSRVVEFIGSPGTAPRSTAPGAANATDSGNGA